VTGHPANGLDDVVHQRVRLGILTIAHEARQVEFGYLRESLELTAGKRARTWVTLTPAGRSALREEIDQLKRLIHQVEGAAG
jgi:hypothetical protein